MIKDRYIWFEEQERHTDIGDIYQVNIGKSNRSGSFGTTSVHAMLK